MFEGQKLIQNTSKGPDVTNQTNKTINMCGTTIQWLYHDEIEYTVLEKKDHLMK